jgi:hypothetical protein
MIDVASHGSFSDAKALGQHGTVPRLRAPEHAQQT